jgi:hypothetical protein
MLKSIEFCQLVTRAIKHTTWNIPRIRDGDRWRNIDNPHLVENPPASTVMTALKKPFSVPRNHAGTWMEHRNYRYQGTVP